MADGQASKKLSFGKELMQNILSAQYLPPRAGGAQYIVAGMDNGTVSEQCSTSPGP